MTVFSSKVSLWNNYHFDNINHKDEGGAVGVHKTKKSLPYTKNDHGECAAGITLTLYL